MKLPFGFIKKELTLQRNVNHRRSKTRLRKDLKPGFLLTILYKT